MRTFILLAVHNFFCLQRRNLFYLQCTHFFCLQYTNLFCLQREFFSLQFIFFHLSPKMYFENSVRDVSFLLSVKYSVCNKIFYLQPFL